jgi:hypothetical protein
VFALFAKTSSGIESEATEMSCGIKAAWLRKFEMKWARENPDKFFNVKEALAEAEERRKKTPKLPEVSVQDGVISSPSGKKPCSVEAEKIRLQVQANRRKESEGITEEGKAEKKKRIKKKSSIARMLEENQKRIETANQVFEKKDPNKPLLKLIKKLEHNKAPESYIGAPGGHILRACGMPYGPMKPRKGTKAKDPGPNMFSVVIKAKKGATGALPELKDLSWRDNWTPYFVADGSLSPNYFKERKTLHKVRDRVKRYLDGAVPLDEGSSVMKKSNKSEGMKQSTTTLSVSSPPRGNRSSSAPIETISFWREEAVELRDSALSVSHKELLLIATLPEVETDLVVIIQYFSALLGFKSSLEDIQKTIFREPFALMKFMRDCDPRLIPLRQLKKASVHFKKHVEPLVLDSGDWEPTHIKSKMLRWILAFQIIDTEILAEPEKFPPIGRMFEKSLGLDASQQGADGEESLQELVGPIDPPNPYEEEYEEDEWDQQDENYDGDFETGEEKGGETKSGTEVADDSGDKDEAKCDEKEEGKSGVQDNVDDEDYENEFDFETWSPEKSAVEAGANEEILHVAELQALARPHLLEGIDKKESLHDASEEKVFDRLLHDNKHRPDHHSTGIVEEQKRDLEIMKARREDERVHASESEKKHLDSEKKEQVHQAFVPHDHEWMAKEEEAIKQKAKERAHLKHEVLEKERHAAELQAVKESKVRELNREREEAHEIARKEHAARVSVLTKGKTTREAARIKRLTELEFQQEQLEMRRAHDREARIAAGLPEDDPESEAIHKSEEKRLQALKELHESEEQQHLIDEKQREWVEDRLKRQTQNDLTSGDKKSVKFGDQEEEVLDEAQQDREQDEKAADEAQQDREQDEKAADEAREEQSNTIIHRVSINLANDAAKEAIKRTLSNSGLLSFMEE